MSATPYLDWATKYATGMANAAAAIERTRPIAQERSRAQSAVAKKNRAEGQATRRCVVPGCQYVWHKGRLCRKHWGQVPQESKVALMVDVILAQRKTTAKHHRRIERELLAALPKDTP